MAREQSWRTVLLSIAILRAIEANRPEQTRILRTGCSRELVPRPWKILLLPGVRDAVQALADLRDPGAAGNLFCRARYIDDALKQALDSGVEQIVILGAGFDLRPYQLGEMNGTRVFEVDLPRVQDFKRASLVKALGTIPRHVTFVPVDFNRQDLGAELRAAGFRTGSKAFFIWEGVTQYITASAVDATLRCVASSSFAGSQIVLTYILRGIIDGRRRSRVDERFLANAEVGGTPWIFGLDPSEVKEYLEQRGLDLLEEVGAEYYREQYLAPISRKLKVYEGERVVLADVPTKRPNGPRHGIIPGRSEGYLVARENRE